MVAQGGRSMQAAGDGWTAALWARVRARAEAARAAGALVPVATGAEVVEDGGVPFVVRVLAGRKPRGFGRAAAADPFDPPEPALTVGEVGPAHVAVLNKYPVIPAHLLIVTRAFEHQETLLTRDDMEALRRCLAAAGGLGFYNGGEAAGASQPHKHLQLVPLPLGPTGPEVPMEAALRTRGRSGAEARCGERRLPPSSRGSAGGREEDGAGAPEASDEAALRTRGRSGAEARCGEPEASDDAAPGGGARLPFAHALAPLGPADWEAREGAERLWRLYRRLLGRIGVQAVRRDGRDWQSRPYNLLVTRRWMMAVPRARERWDGVSVNALGFAGSLLVRDAGELARLRAAGPMRVLAAVAG